MVQPTPCGDDNYPNMSPSQPECSMPAELALLHDRLSEFVACLSGTPEQDVRGLVEQSMAAHDDADALRHVASALVRLRERGPDRPFDFAA